MSDTEYFVHQDTGKGASATFHSNWNKEIGTESDALALAAKIASDGRMTISVADAGTGMARAAHLRRLSVYSITRDQILETTVSDGVPSETRPVAPPVVASPNAAVSYKVEITGALGEGTLSLSDTYATAEAAEARAAERLANGPTEFRPVPTFTVSITREVRTDLKRYATSAIGTRLGRPLREVSL